MRSLLNRTDSTCFNTDRSIFQSTLERAKSALGSDFFVILLTKNDRRDFELYCETTGGIDRAGLIAGLQSLPEPLWITSCTDGRTHYHDRRSNNGFARELDEDDRGFEFTG